MSATQDGGRAQPVAENGRSGRHTPEEARREITEAAVRFLAERPFRDLTVSGLMAGTSLSRPAFYQYFDDLHHLLESMLGEVGEAMHQTANPWLAGEGEPVDALRRSLAGVIQATVMHGTVLRAASVAAPLDPRLERAWAAFMGAWDDGVTARIEAQQAEGLVQPFPARRMANALNALNEQVLIAQFGKKPQGDPEATLDVLHHIWVHALYGQAAKQLPVTDPAPR